MQRPFYIVRWRTRIHRKKCKAKKHLIDIIFILLQSIAFEESYNVAATCTGRFIFNVNLVSNCVILGFHLFHFKMNFHLLHYLHIVHFQYNLLHHYLHNIKWDVLGVSSTIFSLQDAFLRSS
jgi:hypothetical protein